MLRVTVAAATTALTSLTTLKSELKVSGSSDDTYLTKMITHASAAIARHCGRLHFGQETVVQTERLIVPRECIVLDRDLDVSITSVVEDGTTLDSDEYEVDGGLLYKLIGDYRDWWTGPVVVITYQAGYNLGAAVPDALERACLVTAKAGYSARARDPLVRSESLDSVGSASYLDPKTGAASIPPEAAALVEPYVRWRV